MLNTQITQFLCKHTDKSQLDRLIAELVCNLNVSDPDASNGALHALCADLIYKDRMAIAPQNFVTGDDPWPQISTSAHKFGSDLNGHTLKNRNFCIKAIHKKLKTTRPLYDNGYMHWLGDVERVVTATEKAYTAKSTCRMAAQSICQLCEAVSQPALKSRYYNLYKPMLEAMDVTIKRQKEPLTIIQVSKVRDAIETLRIQAIESDYALSPCNDYLQLAWLYGDGPDWQPQRNDCVSFRFDGPDSDHQIDNFITVTDETCTLTINIANKIKLNEPVDIPIHELSPKLADFLRVYQPICAEYQQSNAPYTLMTSRDRKPMSTSHLTTRAPALYTKLGLEGYHGCIIARNCAVAASNLEFGKRKMSDIELMAEHELDKRRLHSRSTAENFYG